MPGPSRFRRQERATMGLVGTGAPQPLGIPRSGQGSRPTRGRRPRWSREPNSPSRSSPSAAPRPGCRRARSWPARRSFAPDSRRAASCAALTPYLPPLPPWASKGEDHVTSSFRPRHRRACRGHQRPARRQEPDGRRRRNVFDQEYCRQCRQFEGPHHARRRGSRRGLVDTL